MTDFYDVLDDVDFGQTRNPYAAKKDGEWIEGLMSVDFLNEHYGKYNNADDMIKNAMSEGHKLYFQWLKDQGILT